MEMDSVLQGTGDCILFPDTTPYNYMQHLHEWFDKMKTSNNWYCYFAPSYIKFFTLEMLKSGIAIGTNGITVNRDTLNEHKSHTVRDMFTLVSFYVNKTRDTEDDKETTVNYITSPAFHKVNALVDADMGFDLQFLKLLVTFNKSVSMFGDSKQSNYVLHTDGTHVILNRHIEAIVNVYNSFLNRHSPYTTYFELSYGNYTLTVDKPNNFINITHIGKYGRLNTDTISLADAFTYLQDLLIHTFLNVYLAKVNLNTNKIKESGRMIDMIIGMNKEKKECVVDEYIPIGL